MDKFGHFFEFFAAVNSAYIVSNHFLESLSQKINVHFNGLLDQIKLIREIQENNDKKLIEEGDKCSADPTASVIVKKFYEKHGSIKTKIDDLDSSIKKKISESGISTKFNHLCLFGSMYCILILILNGFDYKYDEQLGRELFCLFNLFSVGILIYLFNRKRPIFFKGLSSYYKIALIFPVCIGLDYPGCYFLLKSVPKLNCNYDFTIINTIISLLIPTSHFIYYTIRSATVTKRQARDLGRKVQELNSEVEKFGDRLQNIFDGIHLMLKDGAQIEFILNRELI